MEKPVRKRRRPAVACIECRRRKIKCDRTLPCRSCVIGSSPCVYDGFSTIANASTPPSSGWADPGVLYDGGSEVPEYTQIRSEFLTSGARADHNSSASADGFTSSLPHAPYIATLTGPSLGDVQTLTKSTFARTKHITPNHWKYAILKTSSFTASLSVLEGDPQLSELLNKCRELSGNIKLRRSVQRRSGAGIPARITCDRLVKLFFDTFGSVFRVLHEPTFQSEYESYWNDSNFKKKTFHQKLLLVLAIGTCFYYDDEKQDCSLRSLASAWIFQAQQWLVSVFEMGEPDMDMIQISCLLLLARQVDRSGSELVWISADLPLRIAISEGYHLEPSKHFPAIAPFEAEMRRRLWATILELSLQSSLDAGMLPPVSSNAWDCHAPSNVDDCDMREVMDDSISAQASQRFTQSSTQIMLLDTLRVRLNILHSLTTPGKIMDHQEAIMLDSELEEKVLSHLVLIRSALKISSPADASRIGFQSRLIDSLNRRFLLALHSPFSSLSGTGTVWTLSRHKVIESSLRILACPHATNKSSPLPPEFDHLERLRIFGGGMFKNTTVHALALLYSELEGRHDEQFTQGSNSLPRSQALLMIQAHMEIMRRQKAAGDTDTETYTRFLCGFAQIRALDSSSDHLREVTRQCLELCHTVLDTELNATSDVDNLQG